MKFPSHASPDGRSYKREDFVAFIRSVSPDTDPTSIFVFGNLMRVSRELMQALEKNLGAGLSWAKFRLLLDLMRYEILDKGEGLQPSELSAMQGLSRNTVSALIASLEEEGLISRALHPTDRRKFVIRLTPQGRQVLNSELDSRFKFLAECFAAFTPAERVTLDSLLTRLDTSIAEKK